MTIHQRKEPCWVVIPKLPRDDGDPHHDKRSEAMDAIREAWDEDRDWTFDDRLRVRWRGFRFRLSRLRPGAPRPRLLPGRCWLTQCDECEDFIDEMDEGYISHCDSRTAAERIMASYEWVYVGDLVYCPEDAPADGQVPPPSPAELEAAGQLRLPGVA